MRILDLATWPPSSLCKVLEDEDLPDSRWTSLTSSSSSLGEFESPDSNESEQSSRVSLSGVDASSHLGGSGLLVGQPPALFSREGDRDRGPRSRVAS